MSIYEFEHDDFIDGLELGMWSERREMFVPVSEWKREIVIPRMGWLLETFSEIPEEDKSE